MFKVLLCTDGSPHAKKAAEFTAKLCNKIQDAETTVLHVKDLGLFSATIVGEPGVEVIPDMEGLQRQADNLADSALSTARNILEGAGQKAAVRAEWGRPADVICNVGEKEGFDIIVVGRSGMGQITSILLGSVSDRVAHRSTVPVLIVR